MHVDSSIYNSADLMAVLKLVLSAEVDKFDRQYE